MKLYAIRRPCEWASPDDYVIDLTKLAERLKSQAPRIARLDFCVSPDVTFQPAPAKFELNGVSVNDLKLDVPSVG